MSLEDPVRVMSSLCYQLHPAGGCGLCRIWTQFVLVDKVSVNSGWRTVSWGPSTTSGQWPWFYSLTEPAKGIGQCSDGVRTSSSQTQPIQRHQGGRMPEEVIWLLATLKHKTSHNGTDDHSSSRWSMSGCSQLEEDPLQDQPMLSSWTRKHSWLGFEGLCQRAQWCVLVNFNISLSQGGVPTYLNNTSPKEASPI